MAFHANFVDTTGHAGMAVHNHERRHVLNHLRTAADNGHFADSTKLVHRRQPADDGIVLDNHVPGQCAVVAEDHMVADNAIVRDVRVRQKIPVRPDARRQSIAGGGMHCRVFPEHIIRADFEEALTAVKLQVLRFQPDASKRIKFIARPDRRSSVEHDVRMQPATLAKRNVRADDGIRSDFAIRANLRQRIDYGCWMNHLLASFYTNPSRRSTLRLAKSPEI